MSNQGFFSGSSETLKESYQGHLGNLFYILCGHFHEKKIGGTTLPGGRVSRQNQSQSQRMRGVDATFSVFRKQKIRHFEKFWKIYAYYDICIIYAYYDATFSVFRKQKIRHFEKFWKIYAYYDICIIYAYYDAETYRTCWNYHFPFV